MANPYHHALSSVKKWGGEVSDYIAIHDWFDASKELHGDFRHRALRHHAHGIFECERIFGHTITIIQANGKPREIPVRWIGEQHVIEDCGFIPTLSDWLKCIEPQPWMNKPRKLSKELEAAEAAEQSNTPTDKPEQMTNRQYVDALTNNQLREHFTTDEWQKMVQAAAAAYQADHTQSPYLEDEFVRSRLWNLLEDNKKGRIFRDSDVTEQCVTPTEVTA